MVRSRKSYPIFDTMISYIFIIIQDGVKIVPSFVIVNFNSLCRRRERNVNMPGAYDFPAHRQGKYLKIRYLYTIRLVR